MSPKGPKYQGGEHMRPVPHRDPHTGKSRLQSHKVGSNRSVGVSYVGKDSLGGGIMFLAASFGEVDPVAVDTKLGKLYQRHYILVSGLEDRHGRLHGMAGDERTRLGRGQYRWKMPIGEVLKHGPNAVYMQKSWDQNLTQIQEMQTELGEVTAQISELDQVWKQNGRWSRFFLVDNVGGHIHSSMSCSTCFVTTQFVWLPELSGKSEPDAVDEHGGILCSTCFPSAPVEWREGKSKASQEAYEKRNQEKQAKKAATLAKALMVDGAPLRLPDTRDVLKTQRSAEIWLTNSFEDPYGSYAQRHRNDREVVLSALEKKTGKSRDVLLAETTKKVEARRKRNKKFL